MEIVYADAVLSLRQYWKENGIRDDPAKVSGLNKFRCFLEETDQPYSHSTALTWLDEQKDSWKKQAFFCYRKALFELDDLLTTGSVSGKYLYHDTPFSRLPKYWRDMVTAYRNDLKTWKSRRAITEQMPHIITFAGYRVRKRNSVRTDAEREEKLWQELIYLQGSLLGYQTHLKNEHYPYVTVQFLHKLT